MIFLVHILVSSTVFSRSLQEPRIYLEYVFKLPPPPLTAGGRQNIVSHKIYHG